LTSIADFHKEKALLMMAEHVSSAARDAGGFLAGDGGRFRVGVWIFIILTASIHVTCSFLSFPPLGDFFVVTRGA
jgi:hypothetical protein